MNPNIKTNTKVVKSKLPKITKSLVVAIIGRTAAGKSTLINALAQNHLCIVSDKTQTTRQLIRAIITYKDCQIVLTDTPGYQEKPQNALNRAMNRSFSSALENPDMVVWVLDVYQYIKNPTSENRVMDKVFSTMINRLNEEGKLIPSAIILNKIDKLKSVAATLPVINQLNIQFPNTELVPLSALSKKNLSEFIEVLYKSRTSNMPIFPEDYLSDLGEKFFAAEFLREALYKELYQELPFSCAVVVDEFNFQPQEYNPEIKPKSSRKKNPDKNSAAYGLYRISLTIRISNEKHKPIILGDKGDRLKLIATRARLQMERFYGRKVYLQTWIKVNEDWQNKPELLKEFGYL